MYSRALDCLLHVKNVKNACSEDFSVALEIPTLCNFKTSRH